MYLAASGPLGAQLVPEVYKGLLAKRVLVMGDELDIMTSGILEMHICI